MCGQGAGRKSKLSRLTRRCNTNLGKSGVAPGAKPRSTGSLDSRWMQAAGFINMGIQGFPPIHLRRC
jgi:hypothetical protein